MVVSPQLEPGHPDDVATEVDDILSEFFPYGLISTTSTVRSRTICRDAAND